jgi:hypothetical protein
MKKTLVLCFIFSFVAFRGVTQSKGALNLSLGPTIPLGDFAGKNGFSTSDGLANVGALADVSYQHPLGNTRFGWMAALRGRFNGVSKKATLSPLEAEFPGYRWSMNHSRWTTVAALLGGYYRLPLTSKLSLQADIRLGIAESWSPKQSITGIRDSVGFGPVDFVQANLHSVSTTAFTGLAGLAVSYRWNSRWLIMARADYAYLKPTFHNVTTQLINAQNLIIPGIISPYNAASTSVYSTTHNYTQAMSSVDIVVGVTRML